MGIDSFIEKLKNKFRKKEVKKEIVEPVIQKEVLERCLFCNEDIFVDDRFKEYNGNKFHKRCSKKMQKAIMNGENLDKFS